VLISGKVIDAKTKKPLGATIYYEDLNTGLNIGIANSNPATGEYKIVLNANGRYGYRGEANGYIPINENIDLSKQNKYEEIVNRDLRLVPIEQGQVVTINNIFFDFGEYELLPASFPELERLAKIMVQNPKMRILLQGHTDNVGSVPSNMTLSNNRAGAVKKFLVEKGIVDARIQTKGFGQSKPIESNNTEEGRAKNRRVECIILEK